MEKPTATKGEVKYECELCIELYNLYDKKPYSLVPCGHSMCIKCFDSLQKQVCPFCRQGFNSKIPNWEIIKRLPKPTIPIIYYQIQIKMNSLRALSDDFSLVIIKINTVYKENIEKLIANNANNTENSNQESERLKIIEKKFDENHRDNLEIEMNLKKMVENIKNKLELDENKFNDDNLKKIKIDIEKISSKIMDKLNTLKKEQSDIESIFNNSSKSTNETIKKLETELFEKKKTEQVNQQLHTILSLNIVRPTSVISNDAAENSSDESENIYFRTSQKFVIVTVVSVALFIVMLYPLAMIIIGALNRSECSINYLIPIWLIVGGGGGIVAEIFTGVLLVYSLFRTFHHRPFMEKLLHIFLLIVPFIIVIVFNLAWFFTGNAWIYPLYKSVQFDDKTLSNTYCNQTLYLFSFWTLNLAYILFGLFLMVANLICCCVCFLKK